MNLQQQFPGMPPPNLSKTSMTPAEFEDLLNPPKRAKREEKRDTYTFTCELTATQATKLIDYLRFYGIHGTFNRSPLKEGNANVQDSSGGDQPTD